MSEDDVAIANDVERAADKLNQAIRKAAQIGLRTEVSITPDVQSLGRGDKLFRAPEVRVAMLRPIVPTKRHPS